MDTQNQNQTPSSDANVQPTVTTQEKLGGWLAFFVVTMFISIILSVVNFFKDGFLSSSDIDNLNSYKAGLGNTFQSLSVVETVAICVYIGLLIAAIITILMTKKVGKYIAIAALAFGVLYTVIDSATVYSLFKSASLDTNYLSSYIKGAAQVVVYAAIWVPYLILSKRAATTLTK